MGEIHRSGSKKNMLNDLLKALLETLYMTFVPLCIAYVIAIPLSFICVETAKDGLYPNRVVHKVCDAVIAIGRAIPFVILMIVLLPFTRLLIGTGIGTTAVIVPLTIATIPFATRIIETSLAKVDRWIILASKVDGANNLQIMGRIKFMCVLPEIIDGIGIVAIAILGYTTMAGVIGGGGLGNYAMVYGFYRYNWIATLLSTTLIVVVVFIIQSTFQAISQKIERG